MSLSVIVSDPVPIVRIPVTLALPSTIKAVVAVPVFTTSPSLNVPRPTESTFVTSSYVRVPPIETSPVKVAFVDVIAPSIGPTNLVAVTIPDELTFLEVISPVVIWSLAIKPTFPVRP